MHPASLRLDDGSAPISRARTPIRAPPRLRSCLHDGVVATAVVISASTPSMGPELQLRYRAVTVIPRAPQRDSQRVRSLAATLPSLMWTQWSDRLLPDLRKTLVARETLSWATLLAGSTVDTVVAAQFLEHSAGRNALNQRLWVLRSSAHWKSICTALIRLGDHLEVVGAPIDYQRRRQLDYSRVLSVEAW